MLLDFIRHDLDFVFLHEMSDPAILTVTGYTTYLNIEANMRVTAILAKHDFPLTNGSSLRRGEQSPKIITAFVLLMSTHPQARPEEQEGIVSLIPSCRPYFMPPRNLYS